MGRCEHISQCLLIYLFANVDTVALMYLAVVVTWNREKGEEEEAAAEGEKLLPHVHGTPRGVEWSRT